jgi:predicted Zn-dependent protease
VLARSGADEAEVVVTDGTVANLRFARNSPSTSGSRSGPTLTVRSSFGKKTGEAITNQLDDASIADVVKRAEETARLAPDDPEHMPVLGPQTYAAVDAYVEEPPAAVLSGMARGAAACIEAARKTDFVAAGFARSAAEMEARATSAGLFGYHRRTSASLSTTVRSPDGTGSGYAGQVGRSIADLDYPGAASIAAEKAAASRKARPLAPGKYVTILEPSCVADLVQLLGFGMDRRRADEGRSYFASKKPGKTRLGEKLFGNDIEIRSDPADPRCPARPWGDDGVPQGRRSWINRGVLSSLACDRYWATQQKTEPVPRPTNFLMAGGKGSLADLVKSTRKGVLITSFWYIRFLDPQTLTFTGLTRDGVFWIENGEIAHPVNNFRWNDSPVSVLKGVQAMSASALTPPRGDEDPFCVVPALRTSAFNLASVSDAV